VARRYGISSGLLYTWHKALLKAQPGLAAGFARVEVIDHDRPAAAVLPAPAPQAAELIEITLPDGTMLRVPTRIDPRACGALPAHLPRIEVVVDVADKVCPCCGGRLHMIGEDRAEMLDYIPARCE
jgi:hypothetical protein